MGDKSTYLQICNLLNNHELKQKDILELGYLKQSDAYDLKDFFLNRQANLFRTNMDFSSEIDFVWDLHTELPKTAPKLQFDYIICSSVMEHVAKPWVAVTNIENALKTGGFIIWATPWVWRIHGYPEDYWRFTPKGVQELFSKIIWEWIGYEIILDKESSLLINTQGWDKDPTLELNSKIIEKIKGLDIITGGIGVKEKTMSFASANKVDTLNVSIDPDLFIYQTILSKEFSVPIMPMSMFLMLGKKLNDVGIKKVVT